MKKLYLLIFFASMAFLLAGCPPKETPAPDSAPPEPPCVGDECPCEGMECDEPEDENKPILNDTSLKRTYKEHTAEEIADIILQEIPEDYLLEISNQNFINFNNKIYILMNKYNITAADTKEVLNKIQESFTPQEDENDGTETDSTGSEAN